MDKEIKLAVNNLKISFRTDAGKLQAVRDISFNLYKGETLAVVGESGSGKSVTNRAIMGILAGNAIKEGGEIIYDGRDLMKIPEEQLHKLRGDKIAMIFQDPMSSLNPIMRVGKQLTEAMLIKGRVSRSEGRKDFNTALKLVNSAMNHASVGTEAENAARCKKFDAFVRKHLELENAYNLAREAVDDAVTGIDDALFRIEKHAYKDLARDVREIIKVCGGAFNRYVVYERAEELRDLLGLLKNAVRLPFGEYVAGMLPRAVGRGEERADIDWSGASVLLEEIREILTEAAGYTVPNFFCMGYYVKFSGRPLPELPVAELNKFLRKYLDEDFMLEFISCAVAGLKYSAARSSENKKQASVLLDECSSVFKGDFDKRQADEAVKRMSEAVEKSIDRLEVVKDNALYTFSSSLRAAVDMYFAGIKRNAAEEKRFARQSAAYERRSAKRGKPSWRVADKDLADLDEARSAILNVISRARKSLARNTDEASRADFEAKTVALIDYLKEKASVVALRVTRRMAKLRALKLLEEVGIPEPRKRFRQYPFEFSGGMRQRIVIAIALSANPDILICDEPTTALDVTIQSQILELINDVKEKRGLSVIFITHDLGVVANMADRVAVMYAGKIVEIGTSNDIFYSPAHPYTWALLSSMPDLETRDKLEAIAGTPPNMIYPPKGDAFAERNKYALQIDFERQPPMFKITDTHYAATWLLHPDAPRVAPPAIITERVKRMKQKKRA